MKGLCQIWIDMVPMVGVSIPFEPNKDPEALLSSFFLSILIYLKALRKINTRNSHIGKNSSYLKFSYVLGDDYSSTMRNLDSLQVFGSEG